MKFNLGTFIFQLINFFVLLFILKRLLFKPVREMLEKRRAAEKTAMENAEKIRLDAFALKEDYERKHADLEVMRRKTLDKAEEEGEARRVLILKNAEEEAKAVFEKGDAKLARDKEKAATGIRDEIIKNSLAYASAILSGLSDENLHNKILEKLIETMPDIVGEVERVPNSAHEIPVEIVSAYPVPQPFLAKIREKFDIAQVKKISVSASVDTSLLAGAVVKVFDRVYDASLKGNLAAFGQKLKAVQ